MASLSELSATTGADGEQHHQRQQAQQHHSSNPSALSTQAASAPGSPVVADDSCNGDVGTVQTAGGSHDRVDITPTINGMAAAAAAAAAGGPGALLRPPHIMIPLPSLSSVSSGALQLMSCPSGGTAAGGLHVAVADEVATHVGLTNGIQSGQGQGLAAGMHAGGSRGQGTVPMVPNGACGGAEAVLTPPPSTNGESSGELTRHAATGQSSSSNVVGSEGGSGRLGAVGGVGGGSARPGSGGRTRAVHVLVDALRSRDERRFLDTLQALKQQTAGASFGGAGGSSSGGGGGGGGSGWEGVPSGLNDRHPVTGRTPLHEAVALGSVAIVRALLAAGADPNLGHASQVSGGWLLGAQAPGQGLEQAGDRVTMLLLLLHLTLPQRHSTKHVTGCRGAAGCCMVNHTSDHGEHLDAHRIEASLHEVRVRTTCSC